MARRIKPALPFGPQLDPNGTYNLDGQGLTVAQVDSWLLTLLGIGFVGTLIITGCAAPSVPAGMATAAALQTNGATITTDCAIITQDATYTVNEDGTWQIAVATSGSGTTYQWQALKDVDDWEDVSGKTSATFDNPPVAVQDGMVNGQQDAYRCKVTRNAVDVFSSPVLVPVPFILVARNDQTVATAGTLTIDFGIVGAEIGQLSLNNNFAPAGSTYEIIFDDGVNPASVVQSGSLDPVNYPDVNYTKDDVQSSDAGTYKLSLIGPDGARVSGFTGPAGSGKGSSVITVTP